MLKALKANNRNFAKFSNISISVINKIHKIINRRIYMCLPGSENVIDIL